MNGSLYRLREVKQARAPQKVMHVGCQSWTARNLCVESYHEEILYYTTRWDALCQHLFADINVGAERVPARGVVENLLVVALDAEISGCPALAANLHDLLRGTRLPYLAQPV